MKIRGFEIVSKYKNSDIKLPERKTSGSAGYDFSAAKTVKIPPKEIEFIPTGIKAHMPKDEVLQMYPRSSWHYRFRLLQ